MSSIILLIYCLFKLGKALLIFASIISLGLKNGPSNLKIWYDIFEEILIRNGFLRYDENKNNYSIKNDTICYHCSNPFSEHTHEKTHSFSPATFLVVTGGSNEESIDNASENNKRIISSTFNNDENIEESSHTWSLVRLFVHFISFSISIYFDCGEKYLNHTS